jgi:nucleotide-binding universal stress UspA family protein
MQFLVAIDFSGITDAVIRTAEAMAKASAGKVWLLHVAEPDPDFVGYESDPETMRQGVAQELMKEHRRLHEIASELRQHGIVVTPLLVRGPTVETILAEATKLEVDLILLGSHGHGPLHRALLGSVTEGVLKRAPCPLLIVPAAGH